MDADRIICGDNCDVLRTFDSECIDIVVTSPPYDDLRTYGGHSWDFYGVAWNLFRVLKQGGVIVWVVNDQTKDGSETGTSFEQALHFKRLGLRLHDTMVYEKANFPFPDTVRYYAQAEFMFVLSKGEPSTINLIADKKNESAGSLVSGTERRPDGKLVPMSAVTLGNGRRKKEFGVRGNIWRYGVGGQCSSEDRLSHKHPAIFPEKLATDHILSWSNPGDIVLDPFNGSGTTTKCAMRLGRRYLGIEINPEYCEIAEKRLEQKVLF